VQRIDALLDLFAQVGLVEGGLADRQVESIQPSLLQRRVDVSMTAT